MSTIAVDNVRPSLGGTAFSLVEGVAKSWYDYDHTVPEIAESVNLSSITDNGTGVYTTTLTNFHDSATWAAAAVTGDDGGGGTPSAVGPCYRTATQTKTSSQSGWTSASDSGTGIDQGSTSIVTFGGLA